MRLGPKQTTNSMYSHAQSACWSNMFTNSRYILAILRLTRCHVQSKWILDSDPATRVSCIELFCLLLSALGIFSAVFQSAEFKKIASWVVDFLSTKKVFVTSIVTTCELGLGPKSENSNASRFWIEIEPLGIVPVDPSLSCWTLLVSKCNLGQPYIVKLSIESRPSSSPPC